MAVLYGRFVVPSTAGGTRLPSGRWRRGRCSGRKVVAKTRADGSVAEPIAAFDVTFSPSKSVSVLWGAHRRRAGARRPSWRPTRPPSLPGSPTSTRGWAYPRRRRRGAQDRRRRVRDRPVPPPHLALDGPGEPGWGPAAAFALRDPQPHPRRRRGVADARLAGHLPPRPRRRRGVRGHAGAGADRRLGVSWVTPDRRVPMREIAGVPDASDRPVLDPPGGGVGDLRAARGGVAGDPRAHPDHRPRRRR